MGVVLGEKFCGWKEQSEEKTVKEKQGEGENIKLVHGKWQAQLEVNPHRKSSMGRLYTINMKH